MPRSSIYFQLMLKSELISSKYLKLAAQIQIQIQRSGTLWVSSWRWHVVLAALFASPVGVCVCVCVWLLMCVCVSVWVMDAFICEQDFWLCQKGSKWIFRLYYSMASKLLLARVCFSTLPRLPRQLRWSILDFQILRQDIVMAYQSFICRMLWICICLWLAT